MYFKQGFGGQIGAEVTDFVIVLNSRDSVKSFMHGGNLTLGGNLSGIINILLFITLEIPQLYAYDKLMYLSTVQLLLVQLEEMLKEQVQFP